MGQSGIKERPHVVEQIVLVPLNKMDFWWMVKVLCLVAQFCYGTT